MNTHVRALARGAFSSGKAHLHEVEIGFLAIVDGVEDLGEIAVPWLLDLVEIGPLADSLRVDVGTRAASSPISCAVLKTSDTNSSKTTTSHRRPVHRREHVTWKKPSLTGYPGGGPGGVNVRGLLGRALPCLPTAQLILSPSATASSFMKPGAVDPPITAALAASALCRSVL